MKNVLFLLVSLFYSATVIAQQTIKVRFVNNSIWPRKCSFIGYEPGVEGNWANVFTMAPWQRKTYKLPVGTKVYLANQRQVNAVMSGQSISDQKPFLEVKADDAGKSYRIWR